MNLPIPLVTIMEKLGSAAKKPWHWVTEQPTDDDLNHLFSASNETNVSNHLTDTTDLRIKVLDDLRAGKARLVCKRAGYAKVLVVGYPGLRVDWDIWSIIFQCFGPPPQPNVDFWRIVWIAAPEKRVFPVEPGQKPGPIHVNGGYAYMCNPQSIVLYREEEVERVLIHEMLHAACTDSKENSVETIEALTETWAELFLVAVLSRGSLRKCQRLWKIQSEWIVNQCAILEKEFGVRDASDYVWRYTCGRIGVLQSLGIPLPSPSFTPREVVGNSLRLTSPSLLALLLK
jgi:hypothetical protein